MTTADVERHLRELGVQLAEASQRREEVMVLIQQAIRDADAAGVPRSTIATLLGVARQTIYNILDQHN